MTQLRDRPYPCPPVPCPLFLLPLIPRLFQIRIAVQRFLIELEEPAGFLVAEAVFADGDFDGGLQPRDQVARLELDIVEHFADRVAFDHRLDDHFAARRQIDVHGIRVAEQVVQVAENFLIRSDQERRQIIRLAVELMQPQRVASRRGGR